MKSGSPISGEAARYVGLIKERGPLALWEIAVIVETEAFRIEERLSPLLEEGMLITFEHAGRTFLRLPEEEPTLNGSSSLIDKLSLLVKGKLTFQPIPERTAFKMRMRDSCTYKKLITEAYVLTMDPGRYSQEERIRTNLVVERDLKKIKSIDDKKLYLADFIYEKALGKKRSYFKERNLIGYS